MNPLEQMQMLLQIKSERAQKNSAGLMDIQSKLHQGFKDQAAQAFQQAQQANPGAQLNASDYEVPALERWRQQISALVQSGVPEYQKRGLDMMQAYYQAAQPSDAAMPAAIREYQFAQQQGYQGNFADWKKANQQGGTVINLGGKEFVSPSEANSLRYKPEFGGGSVDPFTPKSQLAGKVDPVTAQESKDITQGMKSIAMVDEMDNMLFGDGGIFTGINDSVKGRIRHAFDAKTQAVLQADPRYKNYNNFTQGTLAPLARSLGQAGSLSDTDLELVMGLVPNISEGIPDSKAVAKEKIQKLRRLIMAGQEKGKITTQDVDSIVRGKPTSSSGKPDRIWSPVDGPVEGVFWE